jgi:hypothetical protein
MDHEQLTVNDRMASSMDSLFFGWLARYKMYCVSISADFILAHSKHETSVEPVHKAREFWREAIKWECARPFLLQPAAVLCSIWHFSYNDTFLQRA